MQQVKKMGNLNKLIGMMPGIPKEIKNLQIEDRQIARIEGIVHSMTVQERARPELIDGSRRARIARGAGTDPSDVAQLINQFMEMRRMMKGFGGAGTKRLKGKSKSKGGKPTKGGGRVTAKGPAKVPKVDLTLPGLPGFGR